MNPYERMHAARAIHIELARRARDYQASLAEERKKLEASFFGGFFYGALTGAFLAILLATWAGWWQ